MDGIWVVLEQTQYKTQKIKCLWDQSSHIYLKMYGTFINICDDPLCTYWSEQITESEWLSKPTKELIRGFLFETLANKALFDTCLL